MFFFRPKHAIYSKSNMHRACCRLHKMCQTNEPVQFIELLSELESTKCHYSQQYLSLQLTSSAPSPKSAWTSGLCWLVGHVSAVCWRKFNVNIWTLGEIPCLYTFAISDQNLPLSLPLGVFFLFKCGRLFIIPSHLQRLTFV